MPSYVSLKVLFHTEAAPVFEHDNCLLNESLSASNAYQINLRELTHELNISSNNTTDNGLYNATVGRNRSNTVYGLFMCRGDVSRALCHECVDEAIGALNSTCPASKEAIIWYDMCMLRYSNRSIFSTLDRKHVFTQSGADMLSNEQKGFRELLVATLQDLMTLTASSTPVGAKKFATKEADIISDGKTLYTLAQCTPDLSSQECKICLGEARQQIYSCCDGKKGGTVMYPSCNLRFELYRFYGNDGANLTVSRPPAYAPTPAVNGSEKTTSDVIDSFQR